VKISIITLGCPKNEVDSEILARKLIEENYQIINNLEESEIIIINTCAFITDAIKEAIDVILNCVKFKKRIIVTGCLVSRFGEKKLKKLFPEVEAFFDTYNFLKILNYLKGEKFSKEKKFIYNSNFLRPVSKTFKYVKISEGCSLSCSYCTIPKIKGKQFSRPVYDIVEEIKKLVDNGTKEIILVAQNTGSYGYDLKDGTNLVKLLKEILKINDLKWLRVLYLYPEFITEELLELTFHEKFCSYLDIPIQHIDSRILKLMNRKSTEKKLYQLFEKIKVKYSHIFLRTTVMVGFPTESEHEFQKLLKFIKDIEFYNLGVFKYSKEEGTKAEKLKDDVPKREKTRRAKEILKTQKKIVKKLNKKLVGKKLNVLVEEKFISSGAVLTGRTEFQAPEIDGITFITSKIPLTNNIYEAEIKKFKDYDLFGEICFLDKKN